MDTTPKSTRPLGGRFVWHELLTRDPQESARFYSGLLGWKMEQEDDGHVVFLHGRSGRKVASVVDLSRLDDQGKGSCWLGCVTVDDVEAAAELSQKMAGAVGLPPASLGGGRHAVVADGRGALLAAFSPAAGKEPLKELLPADEDLALGYVRMPPPGHFCWDQLNTRDLDAAVKEYGELLPWTVRRQDGEGTAPGATFLRGDLAAAGALQMPSSESSPPTAPDHWLPFVRVADVAQAVDTARELGGRVLAETVRDEERGSFGVLQDPAGAVIAVCAPPPV